MSDELGKLHNRFTTLENKVEIAIQDLRLGRNGQDVAVELEEALEQVTTEDNAGKGK